MASQGSNAMTLPLLFLNLILYFIVAVIAGWALNYGIEKTPQKASSLTIQAELFPIYFPIGNMATGFFVVLSLVSGVVGAATSLSGMQSVAGGGLSNMASAAASSIVACGLALLAMGLAIKEISIGWRPTSLRALETLTIILGGTQLLSAVTINAGLMKSANSGPLIV